MSQTTATPPPKTYPAELKEIVEQANRGDLTALARLKTMYDKHPDLVDLFGNLAQHAEMALLDLVAGSCLTAKEAIARHLAQMRARLEATANSELEKLLIGRLCLCWLEANYGHMDRAQHLQKQPGSAQSAQVIERRLDHAHQRFLASAKALATVKKLLRSPLSPFELASRGVPEATPTTVKMPGGARFSTTCGQEAAVN